MTSSRSRSVRSLAVVATIAFGAALNGCSESDDTRDATLTSAPDPAPSSAPSVTDSTTNQVGTTTGPAAVADDSSTTTPTDASTAGELPRLPARLDDTEDLDADGFAAQLSMAHASMVDVSAPLPARQLAGVEFQLVLRDLADRPELDEEVLVALDASARPTVEPLIRARQFLQQRSASRPPQPLADEVPAWTIADPEPVGTLLADYAEAERLTGIGWYWLAAIHLQETRMGRIQGVSTAGAVGPMQFLPTTWNVCCAGDPTVTRDAVIGAATYLAQSGGPDDMAAALYQYNPNDGYVAVVTAYAESLRDEPDLYPGYHAFQVFFATSAGTVRLPIGYAETSPIAATTYLATNPQDAA